MRPRFRESLRGRLGGPAEPDPAGVEWIANNSFTIDGTQFDCRPLVGIFHSTRRRFCLLKARPLVERYFELLRIEAPQHIFELGIYDGGSTAFYAKVARPRKLTVLVLELVLASAHRPDVIEEIEINEGYTTGAPAPDSWRHRRLATSKPSRSSSAGPRRTRDRG